MGETFVRLEEWSYGRKSRSVNISHPDGYGAGCWEVQLCHENGVTIADEASFFTLSPEKGGWAAYEAEAKKQGVVFANKSDPDDVDSDEDDWAGLERTVRAALDAFDAGIWGPRKK